MTRTCGCATETCGCCEGTQILTPVSTVNRPGLDALVYRAGAHGTSLETMKARLATMSVQAPGADGQTIETFQPLRGLTTRDAGDPAIALLDSWATVGDVLTFYQERIANEGYLRTATERRSVLELARLVGYALRPGVAATVYLAYTLDDKQLVPVEIPAGARSQSVPGPGELPQSFETSEKLAARAEWNNLQVRLKQPQNITFDSAMTVDQIYAVGNINLKTGSSLLLVFGDNQFRVRTVANTETQFPDNRTRVQLHSVPFNIPAVLPRLITFISETQAKTQVGGPAAGAFPRVLDQAQQLLNSIYLGMFSSPHGWVQRIINGADIDDLSDAGTWVHAFGDDLERILRELSHPSGIVVTQPSDFVHPLLQPLVPQAASSLQLGRSLVEIFAEGSDAQAQLLVNFAPRLKDTFYTAWSNANVNATASSLKAIYALRVEAPLFGANVPRQPTYFTTDSTANDPPPPHKAGQIMPPDSWKEWPLDASETDNALFLDKAYDAILPDSYVIVQYQSSSGITRLVKRVTAVQTVQRNAYGIGGKTTKLTFEDKWRDTVTDIGLLRTVLVYTQSEELTLVDQPITTPVQVTAGRPEVTLDRLYNGLTSGQWVIFSGERADIPGVTGVQASELLMVSALRQDFDPKVPGDQTRTTLVLATPTAYSYKRDTLTIYGNVVKATHGETRNETLGGGDGSQPLQSFTLKQPPLTFVPAPTPAGADSTLKIYVNDVEWHEADTLAGLGPKDRNFITKTDDQDKTSLTFGNGEQGARLPTGVENVRSVYRNGIGKPGNVDAGQISMLQTRPLGVKSVINPLRASGGANRESLDQARENAPLAVMSLDRLVSVQDYADFTRTFAGIGKAASRRLSDGRRELVHVTIAGADDIPIDVTSDLYRNLLMALRKYGDPVLPVQVDSRELLALVLSAKVRLKPDYQWDPVASNIRAAVFDAFGFHKRSLGQPALLCEVIGLIQNMEGVLYVDVDVFGGIPEKQANVDGTRSLLTLDEMADAVAKFAPAPHALIKQSMDSLAFDYSFKTAGPAQRVEANLADFEKGAIRPAQLAIFTSAVPDTLILNQIL